MGFMRLTPPAAIMLVSHALLETYEMKRKGVVR